MCTLEKKNLATPKNEKNSSYREPKTGKALEFGHSYRACATSVNVAVRRSSVRAHYPQHTSIGTSVDMNLS